MVTLKTLNEAKYITITSTLERLPAKLHHLALGPPLDCYYIKVVILLSDDQGSKTPNYLLIGGKRGQFLALGNHSVYGAGYGFLF